jgi:dolichol-phosphate mannosyltransferase
LLGTLGLLSFVLGGLGLVYLAAYWIAGQLNPQWDLVPLHQRPAVIYSLGALLLGGQLMSIGFLAELITAYQLRDYETYSIAERTAEHADKRTVSK